MNRTVHHHVLDAIGGAPEHHGRMVAVGLHGRADPQRLLDARPVAGVEQGHLVAVGVVRHDGAVMCLHVGVLAVRTRGDDHALGGDELLVGAVGIGGDHGRHAARFVLHQPLGGVVEVHLRAFFLDVLQQHGQQVYLGHEAQAQIAVVGVLVYGARGLVLATDEQDGSRIGLGDRLVVVMLRHGMQAVGLDHVGEPVGGLCRTVGPRPHGGAVHLVVAHVEEVLHGLVHVHLHADLLERSGVEHVVGSAVGVERVVTLQHGHGKAVLHRGRGGVGTRSAQADDDHVLLDGLRDFAFGDVAGIHFPGMPFVKRRGRGRRGIRVRRCWCWRASRQPDGRQCPGCHASGQKRPPRQGLAHDVPSF